MRLSSPEITRRRLALLLLALPLVAFLPVVGFGFLDWDDDHLIYRNASLHALGALGPAGILGAVDLSVKFFPLTQLIYACLWMLAPNQPGAFHLANLLVHALNTALLFWLFTEIAPKRDYTVLFGSAFAAALWALHPLRMEVVAWVSALGHALALFFLLGSSILYLRRGFAFASVALFAGAVLSYPVAVLFPLALVLFEAGRRPPRRWPWKKMAPYFLVAACAGVVGIWVSSAREVPPSGLGFGHRLWAIPYFCFHYLEKSFVPWRLAPLYSDLWNGGGEGQLWIGALVFVAVTALAGLRRPFLLLWLGFFFFTVPFAMERLPFLVAQDRYSYVSSTFLFGILLLGIVAQSKRWPRLVYGPLVGVLAAFSFLASAQALVWRNTESLLRHTMSTLEVPVLRSGMRLRLVRYLAEKGELEAARSELIFLKRETPGDLEVNVLEGFVELASGHAPRARAILDSVARKEKRSDALYFLVLAYLQEKNSLGAREALRELERAFPRHPGVPLLRKELGEN